MPKHPEKKVVAVQLLREDLEAIDKAISTGVVTNLSEAIRLGIRYLPRALAAKFLEEDMPKLGQQLDAMRERLREATIHPSIGPEEFAARGGDMPRPVRVPTAGMTREAAEGRTRRRR